MNLSAFSVPTTPTLLTWAAGSDGVEAIQSYLDIASARLWNDEKRQWRLTPSPSNLTTTLDTPTITGFIDAIARDADDYSNYVAIAYTWTDTAGTAGALLEVATAGATHRKTRWIARDLGTVPVGFTPPAGAAAHLLAIAQSLGRSVAFTALSDFAATPGMHVNIPLPDAAPVAGRISAVSWDFATGDMSIRPRNIT
jgi:hypothetical protein